MNEPTTTNDFVIDSYFRFMRDRWGKETRRVRGYQIKKLASALQPATFLDVTEDDLLRWHDSLSHEPETRASYVSAAHGIFSWMTNRARPRIRPDDPSAILDRPRIPERPPRPMIERHFELALACATSDPEIYAWLGLGGCCGLRCCEIAWMRAGDVEERSDGTALLHIVGKGKKRRTMPAGESMLTVLRPFLVASRGPVFTRPSDGLAYTPNGVSQTLNRFLRSIGIHETAHTLRHRFGSDYHAIDPDLYRQAKLMGHSSVDTTQRYTEVSPREASLHVNELTRRRLWAVGSRSREGRVA